MTLVKENSTQQINAALLSLIKELEALRTELETLQQQVHNMGK